MSGTAPPADLKSGAFWTMLECKHCGSCGTSNIVLSLLRVQEELRVLRKLGGQQ